MIRYKTLDGKSTAREILAAVSAEVEDLKAKVWAPKIISLTIGDNATAKLYVRNQRRVAESVGILFEDRNFPGRCHEAEVLAGLESMNSNPEITGIIIQRPVPYDISIKRLQSAISPLKDIEGMHPSSIGNIVYKELELGPCTAMAAVELLKKTGLALRGLGVVIVGHSEIVGKPTAFLLMAEGATVTVCHHMTRNLAVHSRQADAVVVCVGKAGLLTGAMIKPGAAIIDIGINQVTDETGKTRIVGDADFESCAEVAEWITPVPGGVGPVTVAVLMRNTVIATQRQRQRHERTRP